MKKVVLILILIFSISCSQNDNENIYKSDGLITGIDWTLCVCCGGYFIEIEDEIYRFNEEFLPENNLNLEPENLPLKVKLNWELSTSGCEFISITAIQAVN